MRFIKGLMLGVGFFVLGEVIFLFMNVAMVSQAQLSHDKLNMWGNDVTVATGTAEGGISLASDTSGNLYAVRCSTDVSTTLIIYKSTDAGASWPYLTQTGAPSGSLLHPVLLTGSNGDKLYLFYLRSSNNGSIVLLRYTESGTFDGNFNVKVDSDTITYFSACTDMGVGDHLMVVYERQQMGDNTPDLYSIVSTDQGETWSSEVQITGVGSHPDIAYGNDGYLYCVHEKPGTDSEIAFIRSSDYGVSWDAGTGEYLTGDSYDDTYPKVAATHNSPDTSVYVLVVYNHDWGNGNIDLYDAYSTNGGKDWDKNRIWASDPNYNEMACDVWAPDDLILSTDVCYVKSGTMLSPPYINAEVSDVYWLYDKVSDHNAATSQDGREVCQGAYTGNQTCIRESLLRQPFMDGCRRGNSGTECPFGIFPVGQLSQSIQSGYQNSVHSRQ